MPLPSNRLRLTDELGFERTLAAGHDAVHRSESRDWLVLGLGPDPRGLLATLPADARVRYLESPDFFERAGEDWRAAIPPRWTRVESFDPLASGNILLYRFAVELFPSFWAPVCASLILTQPAPAATDGRKMVLVPEKESELILPGIAQALVEEGFDVRAVGRGSLLDVLQQTRPALYLSINFNGLDRHGEVQAVLARAGVPVAVWCVDNPFHCLSGVKTNAWKELPLFVTDAWFVAPLARHGARRVHHLPLAADPAFFEAKPNRPELADKLLFVGRSAFPHKQSFFSGLSLRQDLWDEAQAMLMRGERPDFGWWAGKMGVETFWPGLPARRVGYGAEESGLAWRCLVIGEAARTGKLVVCGDAAWRELVDRPFAWFPSVDYRGVLPGMYASARYVVGAVSPLLPHGLTQRHFDVWAAGGCLITDDTPGLDIFPKELTRQVTYRAAQDIPALAKGLETNRSDLALAWREMILGRHTYRHRIRFLLERLG